MAAVDVGDATGGNEQDRVGGVRFGLRVPTWLHEKLIESAALNGATLNAYLISLLAYSEGERPSIVYRQLVDIFFLGRRGKEYLAFLAHLKAKYHDGSGRDCEPALAQTLRDCERAVLAARGTAGEDKIPEALRLMRECADEIANQREWNDGLHDGKPHFYRERQHYLDSIGEG